MRYFTIAVAMAIVLVAVLLAVVFRPARHAATFYPMGGIPFTVVAYDRSMPQFDRDMTAVEGRVAALEALFDRHSASSELARLNREAAVAPFTMSSGMERFFTLARTWRRESGGAFDPAVGPLVDLWRDAAASQNVPDDRAIAAALAVTGLDKVSSAGPSRILFSRDGMSLDFGAIAKGFIDDEVARLLAGRGVRRGVVDAGGNALAFGEGTFSIGIQDPIAQRGELLATLEVPAGAVVTSGNYERPVTINGRNYSHIIDPRTGKPVDNGMLSATVIGGTAADADALATALMVLGREEGIRLLERFPTIKAVLVEAGHDGALVWASASLKGEMTLTAPWSDRLRFF